MSTDTPTPTPTDLLATAIAGHLPTPWPPLHTHLTTLLTQHTLPPTTPFPDAPTAADRAQLTHLTAALQSFAHSPPHTIQRLAELLRDPRRHYSQRAKWLRALERVLSVESAVDVFPLEPGVAGGAQNGLGSDESLGGALLTRIPWLSEGEGGVGVVDVGLQRGDEVMREAGGEAGENGVGGEGNGEKMEEDTEGKGEEGKGQDAGGEAGEAEEQKEEGEKSPGEKKDADGDIQV